MKPSKTKTKKATKKPVKAKTGLHFHYHLIKQKLTTTRVFLLLILLLLPIITAFLLISNFSPNTPFGAEKNNNSGIEVSPIRCSDGFTSDKFDLTDTAFVNDFNLKINDFKILKTDSENYDNFCVFNLEIFNFGNETLISSEQFIASQSEVSFEIYEDLLPSNPFKINYSVEAAKAKAVNFEIYFVCNQLTQENIKLEFVPFRIDSIASTRAAFPVFDSKKNQYYASAKFEIVLNDTFEIAVSQDLPITITPKSFELTNLGGINLCILRLELTNIGYSPWLFDELDLTLQTAANERLNRMVVNPSSNEIFRKISLQTGQTELADYAFNCHTKGDYILKYQPQYISSDFVENKEIVVKLSL